MKLFIFGLGYSASHFARVYRDRFARIAATVTSQDKADALIANGIDARLFSPDYVDPEIEGLLRDSDALLISVPPEEAGDPVLVRFSDATAGAPHLTWI